MYRMSIAKRMLYYAFAIWWIITALSMSVANSMQSDGETIPSGVLESPSRDHIHGHVPITDNEEREAGEPLMVPNGEDPEEEDEKQEEGKISMQIEDFLDLMDDGDFNEPTTQPPPPHQDETLLDLITVAHDWISPPAAEGSHPCLAEPYDVSTVCSLEQNGLHEEGNVTLEYIAGLIFNNIILDRLSQHCTNRTWCLGSLYDGILLDVDKAYLDYCPLVSCLDNMKYACVDEARRLYLSTLSLLCSAKHHRQPDTCLLSIRRMAHLELLAARDYVRETCSISAGTDEVQEPCRTYGRQLHCTCEACGEKLDLMQTYEPWYWYFRATNATSRCGAVGYDCSNYWKVSFRSSWSPGFISISQLKEGDPRAVTSMVTLVVFGITGLTCIVWVCIRRYHRDKYSRSKISYSEVIMDDEEL